MARPKIPIHYKGQTIAVEYGSNLRKALLQKGLNPYNGAAQYLNCRGLGTCGTCAVKINGSVNSPTAVEKWRLNFPPHQPDNGLRLACQCVVSSELHLKKGSGFWGQHPPADS